MRAQSVCVCFFRGTRRAMIRNNVCSLEDENVRNQIINKTSPVAASGHYDENNTQFIMMHNNDDWIPFVTSPPVHFLCRFLCWCLLRRHAPYPQSSSSTLPANSNSTLTTVVRRVNLLLVLHAPECIDFWFRLPSRQCMY